MPTAVLTRSAIERYAAALAPIGLDAIALPVTQTVRRPDSAAAIAAALRGDAAVARGPAAVFVASRNAAAALADALAGDARAAGPPIFAVGAATAAALPVPAAFVGDADGVALADELVTRLPPGARVLVVCGSDRRPEPLAALRGGGLVVDEVVAYDTIPRAADAAPLRAAAVCVTFAPSQVAALASLADLRALACRWVAIGPTTGAALARLGIAASVAAAPTPEGVAAAVRAVYPPPR